MKTKKMLIELEIDSEGNLLITQDYREDYGVKHKDTFLMPLKLFEELFEKAKKEGKAIYKSQLITEPQETFCFNCGTHKKIMDMIEFDKHYFCSDKCINSFEKGI